MNLLGLDTSSDACSVALQVDNEISARHVVQAKEHTNILLPMIQGLLHDAGVELQELDAIVLGNGPGSFIGMRIAASVAQGLAYGSGLKIVPVSSMAAVAAEVLDSHPETGVVVAQDARMNEVYLGMFREDDDRQAVVVGEEILHAVTKIDGLVELSASGLLAAGKAWQKYPKFLELNRNAISDVVEVYYPNARYLLTLGAKGLTLDNAVKPENLVPAYIRMKVAEKPSQT